MKTEFTIDYDATTIDDAKEYLLYRYKQLGKFGIKVIEEKIFNEYILTDYIIKPENKKGFSVYILDQYRKKGIFTDVCKIRKNIPVVTLKECNIEDYLNKINKEHIVLHHSNAYKKIQSYYNDIRSKRSKVPYIYHIDEGGEILFNLKSSQIVKDAYYLHPILQTDESFIHNKKFDFSDINSESLLLAMEYRRVANSYLSNMEISSFVGFSCDEVKHIQEEMN